MQQNLLHRDKSAFTFGPHNCTINTHFLSRAPPPVRRLPASAVSARAGEKMAVLACSQRILYYIKRALPLYLATKGPRHSGPCGPPRRRQAHCARARTPPRRPPYHLLYGIRFSTCTLYSTEYGTKTKSRRVRRPVERGLTRALYHVMSGAGLILRGVDGLLYTAFSAYSSTDVRYLRVLRFTVRPLWWLDAGPHTAESCRACCRARE